MRCKNNENSKFYVCVKCKKEYKDKLMILNKGFDLIFNELLNEDKSLDEVYLADFHTNIDNTYYHFFASLTDLIHSLSTGRIYSTKNSLKNNFKNEMFQRFLFLDKQAHYGKIYKQ